MNKKAKEKKGFTILELAIAVAVSTIIIAGIFMIFRVGSEQTQFSQTKMLLEDSAREALFEMTQEIRQSAPSRILIGNNGAALQLLVPDPSSFVDASYAVDWDSAHTIQYAIANGTSQLRRTDTATNKTSVLANDVSAIQFAGDAPQPNIVRITISVQRQLVSGRWVPAQPLQLTAEAKVRNP